MNSNCLFKSCAVDTPKECIHIFHETLLPLDNLKQISQYNFDLEVETGIEIRKFHFVSV